MSILTFMYNNNIKRVVQRVRRGIQRLENHVSIVFLDKIVSVSIFIQNNY